MLDSLAFLVLGLAAQSAADGSTVVRGMTAGRVQALAALAVGLLSVVIGALALSRPAFGKGRAPIVAVAAGLIGILFAAVRLYSSTAVGSGSGRLGAIVALAVALIGTTLGALALRRRSRA